MKRESLLLHEALKILKMFGPINGEALKSWLRYNDVKLTRRIKVTNPNATPTIENEQVPSKEELSRIFRASNPRVRTAEALMALADLRPESLGNHDGSDGLTLRGLPELRIEGGEVSFEKVPTMIIVRPNLSKARHKYLTFLINEGCTYLKEYLEERLRSGERLRPESPLIAHERPRVGTRRFLLTRKITHQIRVAMRRTGVYKQLCQDLEQGQLPWTSILHMPPSRGLSITIGDVDMNKPLSSLFYSLQGRGLFNIHVKHV